MNSRTANLVGRRGFRRKTSLDNKGMHTAPDSQIEKYITQYNSDEISEFVNRFIINRKIRAHILVA